MLNRGEECGARIRYFGIGRIGVMDGPRGVHALAGAMQSLGAAEANMCNQQVAARHDGAAWPPAIRDGRLRCDGLP